MKKLFFFLVFVTACSIVNAQTAEDSVKLAVQKLFDGMKSGDAEMVQSSFADSAILQSVSRDKEGKTKIETEAIKGFAEFVAAQPKGAADEQITIETIKIDGPLAIVWAPYKFYFKGKFSHCGIDSFQLVRINGTWKIQYLIDTRKRVGCN